MYKAVFIDVDGTLVRSDHSISDATFNTIQKLKQKNILVILVSARPLSGMKHIAQNLGLLNYPLASLNGAYISMDNEIIFDSIIDATLSLRLNHSLLEYDATIIYYQQDMWFSELQNNNTVYEQKITSVPITIQPFNLTFLVWKNNHAGPNKILVISKEKEIDEIQKCLKREFIQDLNIYTSKSTYIEIMNSKTSKVNSVRLLMNRFNIKRAEIIALGDNFNDKEMIEFAGLGIAMGNAPTEVKAVANYIADTNDNDGVAKALEEIVDF